MHIITLIVLTLEALVLLFVGSAIVAYFVRERHARRARRAMRAASAPHRIRMPALRAGWRTGAGHE